MLISTVRSICEATYLVLAVAITSCGSSGHLDSGAEELTGCESGREMER